MRDRTALVSGATSGFGEAIALLFAQEGASVIAHGRNVERGDALVRRLEGYGVDAHFVKGDVGEPDDAQALADVARREFGHLDALVLNAGVADLAIGKFWNVSVDEFDALWRTNVRGMWLCARACAPLIRDGGSVVAMARRTARSSCRTTRLTRRRRGRWCNWPAAWPPISRREA